jgi:hypothetical protein
MVIIRCALCLHVQRLPECWLVCRTFTDVWALIPLLLPAPDSVCCTAQRFIPVSLVLQYHGTCLSLPDFIW